MVSLTPQRIARRILIIDDTESDVEAVQRCLATDAYYRSEITVAPTLKDGLVAATTTDFDLALVDWLLPDGQGIEFGRLISESGGTLPFVLMTGQERPSQVDDALAYGAVDFIAKSDFSPRILARLCEHAIVRARLAQLANDARKEAIIASRLEREARAAVEQALSEQAQLALRLARLNTLTSMFSAAPTNEKVANAFVSNATVFGNPVAASFHLLQGDALVMADSYGLADPARWTRTSIDDSTPLGAAAASKQIVHVSASTSGPAGFANNLGPHDTHHCIAAPMCTEGRVLGVIGLWFSEGQRPAGEEFDFFKLVAELAAQAIVRTGLYEEAARRVDFEKRLLAIVGHDLRTPLAAIVTCGHLLTQKYPSEGLVLSLKRSASRMNELIEDVMLRSQMFGAHDGVGPSVVVDVSDIVREALDESKAAFPGRRFICKGQGELPAEINRHRVTQALSNLIRNAVQYGDATTPVTISYRLLASELSEGFGCAGGFCLSVHNDGVPIPADKLKLLFDPFSRGSTAPGKGLGLGLFIVHELVTAMGGRVEVSSDHHETCFSLILPRNRNGQGLKDG